MSDVTILPPGATFDPDTDFEAWLEEKAKKIDNVLSASFLEAGAILAEVNDKFRYKRNKGGFRGWVEKRFAISKSTAYNMMNSYNRFGQDCVQLVDTIGSKALYLLAAPSTPEAVGNNVLQSVREGESVTLDEINEMIGEATSSKKRTTSSKKRKRAPHRRVEASEPVSNAELKPDACTFDKKKAAQLIMLGIELALTGRVRTKRGFKPVVIEASRASQ